MADMQKGKIMEIKHYNALAKIIGGNLQGYPRIEALINSLSRYFEGEDETFNPKEFRSACLNGHCMEETSVIDVEPKIEEIMPVTIENRANN